jgi:hypothetical protein
MLFVSICAIFRGEPFVGLRQVIMRRKIAYVASAIFLLLVITVTSCGGDDSVNLIFNQVPGDCATSNQSAATIQCDGGVLTFEGSVVTPNPCYYLRASLDFMDKSNIIIAITADSPPGQGNYCVECVGEIAFSGEVSPVGSCSRNVSIVYNGVTIAEHERQ